MKPSREIAEVEVESVAFVVLDALNVATGDYSFPYVAQWSSGDADLVRKSADRVISCARSILAASDLDPAVEVTAPRP